ncbi:MAG TPA: diguanylate cyclase [Novosphingobium sp.]|nr:diguanylate cyclase [Novosphingobium sp.]
MKRWKARVPGFCVVMALAVAPAYADAVADAGTRPAGQPVAVPYGQDQQRTSRGFDLIRSGKPKQAIAEFDAVIAASEHRHLSDPRPRFCGRVQNDARLRAGTADAPVLIDPAVCDAHFGKGYALIDMGRGDLAEAELRRAMELAPFDAHYANEYAELFKSRRDWHTSLALFTRAWSVVDKNPAGPDAGLAARALRGIGYNEMMLGNFDEAESRFRQSLDFEADSKAARIELAYIARKKAIGS